MARARLARSPDLPPPATRTRPARTRPRRGAGAAAAMAVAVLAGTWAITSCASRSAVPSDPKLAQGKQVFEANCVGCHGATGGGGAGPRLIGVADRMSEDQEIATITNGVSGTAMPAWGSRLSAEEIEAVAAYTRSFSGA